MVLKNNKFLHCELCDCAVSKKFGQHLAGEVHHVRFENAKKKVTDADAKEGETELEASSRLLNEAVDSLINPQQIPAELCSAGLKYRVVAPLITLRLSAGELCDADGRHEGSQRMMLY